MTTVISSIQEWKIIRKQFANSVTLGFVPTMGALHAGHLSLLKKSKQNNTLTVLSIFVNPTQFNVEQDLKNYPRTFPEDLTLAKQTAVDYLFFPSAEEMYADKYQYCITENSMSTTMEGKYRPGHFNGMLTVVMKLLQIIKPDRLYLGEKDYQQAELIKGMAQSFFLDTEIVTCPTIRDERGLALSSRNQLLSVADYEKAILFPRMLQSALSCKEISKMLSQMEIEVDYIEEHNGRRFGAVKIGQVRLIDNVLL